MIDRSSVDSHNFSTRDLQPGRRRIMPDKNADSARQVSLSDIGGSGPKNLTFPDRNFTASNPPANTSAAQPRQRLSDQEQAFGGKLTINPEDDLGEEGDIPMTDVERTKKRLAKREKMGYKIGTHSTLGA
jgi:hypothetical protein